MDIFSCSKFCNWLVKISAIYKSEILSHLLFPVKIFALK